MTAAPASLACHTPRITATPYAPAARSRSDMLRTNSADGDDGTAWSRASCPMNSEPRPFSPGCDSVSKTCPATIHWAPAPTASAASSARVHACADGDVRRAATCVGGGHRSRRELDAARTGRERDIGAIVHDEPRAGLVLQRREATRELVQYRALNRAARRCNGDARPAGMHHTTRALREIGAQDDVVARDGWRTGSRASGGATGLVADR